MTQDPEAFRASSRQHWEDAAEGWEAARAAFQTAAQPVSERLVELVHPQPGQTLVELAAGPADTGLLAAQRIQPGGRVLLTDGAEAMVEVARRRAEELGLSALIEARPMDLEWLDLSTATVDGILCRFGYMLVADPETALRETRRVLRPGGRLALAVWDDAAKNPWSMGRLLVQLGHLEATPGVPGPFALGDPTELEELVASVGFVDDLVIEPLNFTFTAPDGQAWWEQQQQLSVSLKQAVAGMSPAEVYTLRDQVDEALAPYTAADGSLAIPARALLAAASA